MRLLSLVRAATRQKIDFNVNEKKMISKSKNKKRQKMVSKSKKISKTEIDN